MKLRKFLLLTTLIFSFTAFTNAQENDPKLLEMHKTANEFFQKKDYLKSAESYEQIIKLKPEDARALFRYGLSLHGLGKSKEAIQFMEKGISLSNPNMVMPYYLAAVYAKAGEREKAYLQLEKIISSGVIEPKDLTEEKDFVSMQEEKRFKDLVTKADLAANPCKASPEYRQFDFWIGEWEAKTPQGFVAGTNKIELILGDCIILENWTQSNMSGKSFNIYDKTDKKWHQTWVDSNGTLTEYVGEFKDGKMVYLAEEMRNDEKVNMRLTFSKLPDGNVRQFAEESKDDGKTWQTRYEIIYSPKK
jgi:tetratricopeptide (TPR) repeat protein